MLRRLSPVAPAKAGGQDNRRSLGRWIPAFAGMTNNLVIFRTHFGIWGSCFDRLAVDRVCAARDRAAGSRRRRRGRSARTAPRRRAREAPAGCAPGRKSGSASPRSGASRRGSHRDRSRSARWRSRSTRPAPAPADRRAAARPAPPADRPDRETRAETPACRRGSACRCATPRLVRRQPGQPRHLGEIGGEFALVAHRDMPQPGIGARRPRRRSSSPAMICSRSARDVASGS